MWQKYILYDVVQENQKLIQRPEFSALGVNIFARNRWATIHMFVCYRNVCLQRLKTKKMF